MPDAFLLSPPTGDEVRRLIADGGDPLTPVPPTAMGDGLFVKVTGAASSGTYPGRLVGKTSPTAAWADLGGADVRVVGANGETLVTNKVYLCGPTGPAADGTPAYAATVGGETPSKYVTDIACSGGKLVVTYGP